MRQGKVYYKDHLAGIITETNEGEFVFQYDRQYVKNYPNNFITFTMPVTNEPYKEKRLFPFFEGWLLNIASENWKINRNYSLFLPETTICT